MQNAGYHAHNQNQADAVANVQKAVAGSKIDPTVGVVAIEQINSLVSPDSVICQISQAVTPDGIRVTVEVRRSAPLASPPRG